MECYRSEDRVWLEDPEGKEVAFVSLRAKTEHTVEIVSTVVNPSLRGQGIASALMKTVAQEIRAQGKTVIPLCSYAVSWFAQHPQESDLLVGEEAK